MDTIRAWKDEEYRKTLDEKVISPVGELELNDDMLLDVSGAGCKYTNTNALACVQSVLIACNTINGNCGNAI